MGHARSLLDGPDRLPRPPVLLDGQQGPSPFADDQGKEALNFAIGINIGYAVSTVLVFLMFFSPWFALAGAMGWLLFVVVGVILPFRAGFAAYHGEVYRYPLAVRFIS